MRAISPERVFATLVVAFMVWVWTTSPSKDGPRIARAGSTDPAADAMQADPNIVIPENRAKPLLYSAGDSDRSHLGTARRLEMLKPGMDRVEVERWVGSGAPLEVHPIHVAGGKATYQIDYRGDLAFATKKMAKQDCGFIRLEFDATATGHPLICVEKIPARN